MTAAGAQIGLAAAVLENRQTDAVCLWCGLRSPERVGVVAIVLDPFLHDQFVGHAARINRQAVVVAHAAQFGCVFRR